MSRPGAGGQLERRAVDQRQALVIDAIAVDDVGSQVGAEGVGVVGRDHDAVSVWTFLPRCIRALPSCWWTSAAAAKAAVCRRREHGDTTRPVVGDERRA